MSTQLKSNARDPGKAGPDLSNPPAFDEAGIWVRSDGRQLKISTGADPEADRLNVHPAAENGEESAPATGEHSPTPVRQGGDIGGFSQNSRRRLRDRLHSMEREEPGLFVTLTYHEHLPTPEEAKADLDAFGKWVLRHFPGASITWKLEPQKRGWPHFHCIITGVEYIPIQKMAAAWHRITEEGSYQHRDAGVDVEPMVNENGKLQAYMADYMEETYEGWPSIMGHRTENIEAAAEWADYTGRWWGVIGRDNFPWAAYDDAPVYLNRSEAQFLIRELLDEWESDLPEGVIPPTLTVNARGDPTEMLDDLLDRL